MTEAAAPRFRAGQTRVAFVGLGVMGRPMALNVLGAGFDVVAHTRTPARADAVRAAGARIVSTAAEAADGADVAITMLPDSPDVLRVLSGPHGLLEGARDGLVWIDMSSIAPQQAVLAATQAAGRGIRALDAPVSGGEAGAVDGSLTILVGGDEQLFLDCQPIFRSMGSSVTRMGPAGAGQLAKLCNQLLVGAGIAAVAEAFAMADKAGIDLAVLQQALSGGLASSRVLDKIGTRIIRNDFTPGFRIALHHKDLVNALDAGRAHDSPMIVTAVVSQLMAMERARGGGELDHAALVELYRARS